MSQGTKDVVKGTLHQVTGTVKATVGKITDNPKLTGEGEAEKLAGKVQEKVGKVERVFEK